MQTTIPPDLKDSDYLKGTPMAVMPPGDHDPDLPVALAQLKEQKLRAAHKPAKQPKKK